MFNINWKRIKSRLTGQPKLQDPARQQEKFKARYPSYNIGRGSYGAPIVHDNHGKTTLSIGSYCSIASNVQIFLGGQHRIDTVSSYPFPFFNQMDSQFSETYLKLDSRGDVIIGSDVWLCANCIILSGVTIGHGAVIANGALISRNVEPYAVMAGNPAKLIKWRFDEETRNQLLASGWWQWPEDEINKILALLCNEDLTHFLNYSKNRIKKTSLNNLV